MNNVELKCQFAWENNKSGYGATVNLQEEPCFGILHHKYSKQNADCFHLIVPLLP